MGGLAVIEPLSREQAGVRSALLHLIREVERGAVLSENEAEANLNFAKSVRDTPGMDTRAALRAVELIELMRSRFVNVAMHMTKPANTPPAATVSVAGGLVFNIYPATVEPHLNGHANGVADGHKD